MSDDNHDDTYDPRKALFEQVALSVRHEDEEEVLGGLIPEMVDQELGKYDEDLIEELEKHAKRLFKKERAQEAGWRERTVNDNIDDAFGELYERGILALENAGYMQSDGWTEVLEVAAQESSRPRGAIYYTGQTPGGRRRRRGTDARVRITHRGHRGGKCRDRARGVQHAAAARRAGGVGRLGHPVPFHPAVLLAQAPLDRGAREMTRGVSTPRRAARPTGSGTVASDRPR